VEYTPTTPKRSYKHINLRVFGLCPSSGILENRNTTFRKLDLLPSSDEREKTPTLLGPLERTNLNHSDTW
jgi:hypothetical protein